VTAVVVFFISEAFLFFAELILFYENQLTITVQANVWFQVIITSDRALLKSLAQ
jgi:hypothetical protein